MLLYLHAVYFIKNTYNFVLNCNFENNNLKVVRNNITHYISQYVYVSYLCTFFPSRPPQHHHAMHASMEMEHSNFVNVNAEGELGCTQCTV